MEIVTAVLNLPRLILTNILLCITAASATPVSSEPSVPNNKQKRDNNNNGRYFRPEDVEEAPEKAFKLAWQ